METRTLSVLALVDPSGEGYTTYTMRTSIRRPRIESEITKVSALISPLGSKIAIDWTPQRMGTLPTPGAPQGGLAPSLRSPK